MTEFTINGKNYRTGKMNARTQFHVARKVAPLFADLASSLRGRDLNSTDTLMTALPELVSSVSTLPDETCDYVIDACLAVTQRQEGATQWVPVWNVQAKQPQFADMDMMTMLQIVGRALMDNLGGFFNALPSDLPGGVSPQGAQ